MYFDHLNKKVRTLRESNDLSKEQMCELLDIEIRTYDKVENGQRLLSLLEIEKLCNHFNIHPQELLFGEPKLVFTHSVNHGIVYGGSNAVVHNYHTDKVISTLEQALASKDKAIEALEEVIKHLNS